jgi:hypothetical protein
MPSLAALLPVSLNILLLHGRHYSRDLRGE